MKLMVNSWLFIWSNLKVLQFFLWIQFSGYLIATGNTTFPANPPNMPHLLDKLEASKFENPELASQNCKVCMDWAKRNEAPELHAKCLYFFLWLNIYERDNNIPLPILLSWAKTCERIFKESGDYFWLGRAQTLIAQLKRREGALDDAINILDNILNNLNEIKNPTLSKKLQGEVLHNKALVLSGQKEPIVIAYFLQSIKRFKEGNNQLGLTNALLDLSRHYYENGDFFNAQNTAKGVEKRAAEMGFTRTACRAKHQFGRSLILQYDSSGLNKTWELANQQFQSVRQCSIMNKSNIVIDILDANLKRGARDRDSSYYFRAQTHLDAAIPFCIKESNLTGLERLASRVQLLYRALNHDDRKVLALIEEGKAKINTNQKAAFNKLSKNLISLRPQRANPPIKAIVGITGGITLFIVFGVWLMRKISVRKIDYALAELECLSGARAHNFLPISKALIAIRELKEMGKFRSALAYLKSLNLWMQSLQSLSSDSSITVAKEMELLNCYVNLKQRLSNRELNCQIKIPEKKDSIDKLEIPQFILLPILEELIENMVHANQPIDQNARIKISFQKPSEGKVKCLISGGNLGNNRLMNLPEPVVVLNKGPNSNPLSSKTKKLSRESKGQVKVEITNVPSAEPHKFSESRVEVTLPIRAQHPA